MLAEARQQAAELDARAKIRLAEGVQAEAAAAGLAEVQVKERDAEAIEKVGRAEAMALGEKLEAEAEGARAMALVEGDRLKAQAEGEQAMAVAAAAAIGEKLKAEAEGLTEKAAAMAALDDASRAHEEYRLRLEAEKEIRLKQDRRSSAGRRGAGERAVAPAWRRPNIDIVGGDSDVLRQGGRLDHRGQGASTASSSTPTWRRSLAAPYLNGSRQPDRRTWPAWSARSSTEDLKNLTVSALLHAAHPAGRAGLRAAAASCWTRPAASAWRTRPVTALVRREGLTA